MLHETVSGLATAMSVHPQDLSAAVERLAEQLRAAQRELGRLQAEMLIAEARRLYAQAEVSGNLRLILAAFRGRTMNDLRALGKELRSMPGAVAVLTSEQAGETQQIQVQFVVACAADTGLRAQELLKPLLAQTNGKGGGDASMAQGGGSAAPGQMAGLLEAARRLIIDAG
jgi:alanyl-tRNA synthetase